jgi:hypothetical protein
MLDENHASTAIAAFVMASAILNQLREKNILPAVEIATILDRCLLTMEELGVDNPTMLQAHRLIEATTRAYCGSAPPSASV